MSIEEKRIAADILIAMINKNLLDHGKRLPFDKNEMTAELFKYLYKMVSNPDLPYKDIAPPWCR